jgi:hypothetical protein
MQKVTWRALGLAGLALLAAATAASAQAPVRVRGEITKVEGNILSVKLRDGQNATVKLAEPLRIAAMTKASMADIKEGTFIGVSAMPQPDGTQKAVEIHIFPEAARGTGEGHRPWDLMPGSTMTNANVDSEVAISDGKKLVLKYKDGDKTFIVPDNVKVVMFAPGSAADLKPGAKIFIVGAKKEADGTLDAGGLTVGANGVDPPM